MELDQMEMPTATAIDSFPLNQQGITWGTSGGSSEPTNWDVLVQPSTPDISLLQSAMLVACIDVEPVPQDSAHTSWIIGDSGTTTPNAWDITTLFVHNLISETNPSSVESISNLSQDVSVNNISFWCIHGIGAYESIINYQHDLPKTNPNWYMFTAGIKT